jgi:hypothetical protein
MTVNLASTLSADDRAEAAKIVSQLFREAGEILGKQAR